MSIIQIEKEEIFCSVIMPVHNGERFLRKAIESVLNQTYTNFEFLIIKNCSTDSSLDIIESYDDNRIRLIIEKDCGQVQAYNRGFREAKGEYIFIHDQDDVSHHERFEKQLNCMLEQNVDICGSYFNLMSQSGKIIGHIKMPTKSSDIIDELVYKNSTIFNSSVCIRKTVFANIGYFDILYYPSADYDFYLKGLTKFSYANVPETLYSWRQHEKQISSSDVKTISEKTILISLKNKNKFPPKMLNTYIGLIYYFNNKLLKSFSFLLLAVITDKFSKKLLRYLIITFFFGIPLKIFRKFNLLHSEVFIQAKNILNKVL